MSKSLKTDVIIIGAGIMGASCAFRLSEQGLKVLILEAQNAPAMGSTGRSAAGVRVQFTEEVNIRLSWESIKEYQHFEDLYGEDAGYRPIGYLLLVSPERLAMHLDGVRLQEQIGVPVQVLSTEEAEYLVNVGGAWAGEVAARAGLEVPVHPVRRNVYATAQTSWRHSYPLTIDLQSGFYLRSEGGRVLFGRSKPEELPGFTEGID